MKAKIVKKISSIGVMFFTLMLLSSCSYYTEAIFGSETVSKKYEKLDMEDFWEVYEIIEDEHFNEISIKKEELVRGAIKGMVEALNDEHSEFMDPEVYKKFHEALEGDFEGIGAVVEKVPLGVRIERIIKGSPAKKYGVRSGDIVIEANDFPLEDLDLYDAVDKIKGPAGTQVLLKILRSGEEEILEIQVIREKIHIPSVEYEILDKNIGYISLNRFAESTTKEFQKALQDIQKENIEDIIIDVRDNGGGYLQSAVTVLSEFINQGDTLVQTRYKKSFLNQSYYSLGSDNIFQGKIVVLINQNSASASEILAGALREYNKAILVGEKTFGKGSVQQPYDMHDGSLLKLTVAKWYTPQGRNIEEEGIDPDIEVLFLNEDYENNYDRQLEEAKDILKLFKEHTTIGLSIEAYSKRAENTSSVNEK